MDSITKIESGWHTRFANINAQSSVFTWNRKIICLASLVPSKLLFSVKFKIWIICTVFVWSVIVFSLSCTEYSYLLSNQVINQYEKFKVWQFSFQNISYSLEAEQSNRHGSHLDKRRVADVEWHKVNITCW